MEIAGAAQADPDASPKVAAEPLFMVAEDAAGYGWSGGAAYGTGGACGPTVTYQPQTVMHSQYVTETRMVPMTTYQQQTQTRMRNVTRQVARVQTRQQTYTVNVPQTQTRTETYTVQVCVPYTEEVPYTVQVPVTTQVEQSYQVSVPYTEQVEQTYTVSVPKTETREEAVLGIGSLHGNRNIHRDGSLHRASLARLHGSSPCSKDS